MSIYISIASYRDEMLKHTVLQALNKAKDPNGLSFGVVEQAYENERLKVSDALSKDTRTSSRSSSLVGWAMAT